MKLLFCQECGDIIAPHRLNHQPRWCRCKRHAVWWEDGARGILRLWDAVEGPERSKDGPWYPIHPRAYVIGLTNVLLNVPDNLKINSAFVQEMIDVHDDSYLFHKWRSLVIRIRPGESSDTAWATLPPETPPEAAWEDCAKVIAAAQAFCAGEIDRLELDAAVAELATELDRIDAMAETQPTK